MRKIDLLKAMKTFTVVVECGSFSKASKELSIVTSAISKQISDIEQHFSAQLLNRTTRAMHITAEGEFYLKRFNEILAKVEELENISKSRNNKISGKIRISAPVDSESLGIFKRASEFVKLNPQINISWVFVNRFVNMVEEGVDISVRIGTLSDSNLIAKSYGSTHIHYVASPQYIDSHGVPKHPKDLSQHRCILDTSNQEPYRWRYNENGIKKHIQLKPFMEVNDGVSAAKLAAEGHGIAFLPTFLMHDQLNSGMVIPILRDFEFEPSPVSIVYPYHLQHNSVIKSLIDYIFKKDER
ncbi:LysR family transcriptional regulator [Thalassotalea atypica]|uniref:LysR family transcriptional regulator n=1 Tax=Thalassotalea atypica TaxID=2054316 RepID=UPI00257274AE|nr:LysR family transcriptional regulator [Thalassotalea atypica]